MISIILAAGKGTRMGGGDRPKVCFELDGVPIITRSVEIYTRCGIDDHIIVVGERADQVAATVCARFPRTVFAFQSEPRGPGHATRCGVSVLDVFGYAGDVLVVAGDKVLKERAVREQLECFRQTGADLCLLVGAKDDFPTSGRIVEDGAGGIRGVVEVGDIARGRLVERWLASARVEPLPAERLRADMLEAFPTEAKARRAMPALWRWIESHAAVSRDDLHACCLPDDSGFEFAGPGGRRVRLSADEIERDARYAYLCVCLFRIEALRYALDHLNSANAQGEEYLPDTVGVLAAARTPDGQPRFRIVPCCVAEPTDALAFNTMEELLAIREHYRNLGSN